MPLQQFQVGQVYQTGNIQFCICEIHPVTNHFKRVKFLILDSGAFVGWEWVSDNQELQKGIDDGTIILVKDMTL